MRSLIQRLAAATLIAGVSLGVTATVATGTAASAAAARATTAATATAGPQLLCTSRNCV